MQASTRRQVSAGLGLILLLFGIYLLVYRGSFTGSPDEYWLFDSTESFVNRGNLNVTYMYHREFDQERVVLDRYDPVDMARNAAIQRIANGNDPFRTSWYEPMHPLLGTPLYLLGQQFDTIGNINAVYLVNLFVTATTAGVLYWLVLKRGYSMGMALALGLIYGLGTNAFPFAQYNIREPITSMFILLAFFFALEHADKPSGRRLILLGISLALALLSKVASIFVMPGILLLVAPNPQKLLENRKVQLAAGGGILALVLFLILLTNVEGSMDRLTLPLLDYIQEPYRRQHALEALLYYQVGWGRSLWFYNPVFLLGFVSTVIGWRKGRMQLSIGFLIAMIAMSLLYGIVHTDHWTGGALGYGLRYFSILFPTMVLWLAPALKAVKESGNRLYVAGTGALIAVSVIMQGIGTLFNSTRHFERLSAVVFPPWDLEARPTFNYSHPFTHVKFLVDGVWPDIAWFSRADPAWIMPLIALIIASFGGFVLYRSLNDPIDVKRIVPIGVVLVASGCMAMLFSLRFDPAPTNGIQTLEWLVIDLSEEARPDDIIILLDNKYYEPFMNDFETGQLIMGIQGRFRPTFVQSGQPIEQIIPTIMGPGTFETLQWVPTAYDRMWVVGEQGPEWVHAERPVNYYLAHAHYHVKALETLAEEQASLYYMAYAPQGYEPAEEINMVFGDTLRLIGYDLEQSTLEPGETVALSLVWQTENNLTENLHMRMALVNEAGEVVVEREELPQGRFGLTSYWEVGSLHRDHYGLELPEDIPPGTYRVVLTVMGDRLALLTQESVRDVTLTTITVR